MVFESLYKVLHELDNDQDSSFVSAPIFWRFLWCAESLLKGYNEDDRYRIISSVFNNHNITLSTIARLLQKLESEHNRFAEKDTNVSTQLLPLQKILELESIFFERAIHEMNDGTLICDFGRCIPYLLENIDTDRAKSAIEKMIRSDNGLINLITWSVSTGTIFTREVSHYHKVVLENMAKFIDADVAYKRIKAFADTCAFTSLDLKSKQYIAAFLIHIEKGEVVEDDFETRDKILNTEIDSRIKEIEIALHKK